MAAHIETGTMASPQHYSSKRLNHLGLVAGMYDEPGLGELIDTLILQDNALYVAETLRLMQAILWISRVPETLTLARDIIHAVAPNLMSNPQVSAHRSLGVVYGVNTLLEITQTDYGINEGEVR